MANIEAFLFEHGLWMLVGLAIIFMVLAIIRLVLSISKSTSGNTGVAQTNTADVPPSNATELAPRATADDTVTAAIITAAIAAYMAEQGIPENGFRVVSFRRVSSGRAWNNK